MTTGEWVGAAGIVVAGLLTFVFARMYGTRRAKVEISVTWTRLLARAMDGSLEVLFRGEVIANPHLVEIKIKNVGPRDVASATFDEGKPISILFGRQFYGLVDAPDGVRTIKPAMLGNDVENSSIGVMPALLKKGETWTLQAMIAGRPNARFDVPLIDTTVSYRTKANVQPHGRSTMFISKNMDWRKSAP